MPPQHRNRLIRMLGSTTVAMPRTDWFNCGGSLASAIMIQVCPTAASAIRVCPTTASAIQVYPTAASVIQVSTAASAIRVCPTAASVIRVSTAASAIRVCPPARATRMIVTLPYSARASRSVDSEIRRRRCVMHWRHVHPP